jgi:hypothetical protein
MHVATITPAAKKSLAFSHSIEDSEGRNVGLIYPEINKQRGTTMYVELNKGGREVRSLEDAQIYADMVLTGEWAKVSSGEVPGPFDY